DDVAERGHHGGVEGGGHGGLVLGAGVGAAQVAVAVGGQGAVGGALAGLLAADLQGDGGLGRHVHAVGVGHVGGDVGRAGRGRAVVDLGLVGVEDDVAVDGVLQGGGVLLQVVVEAADVARRHGLDVQLGLADVADALADVRRGRLLDHGCLDEAPELPGR